jgi:hypothetical protein
MRANDCDIGAKADQSSEFEASVSLENKGKQRRFIPELALPKFVT